MNHLVIERRIISDFFQLSTTNFKKVFQRTSLVQKINHLITFNISKSFILFWNHQIKCLAFKNQLTHSLTLLVQSSCEIVLKPQHLTKNIFWEHERIIALNFLQVFILVCFISWMTVFLYYFWTILNFFDKILKD